MWGRGGGSRFLLAGLIVSAFVLLLYWWFGRDFSSGADVRVVYMGGFDCNFVRCSDTAWIFRADVATILR